MNDSIEPHGKNGEMDLHLGGIDGRIPVNCLLASASVHDSQATIPLTTRRVEILLSTSDCCKSPSDRLRVDPGLAPSRPTYPQI